jgi:hypothetical protein
LTFEAFLPPEMAHEEKRVELRPVEEVEETELPVIRLESEKPVRLSVSPEPEIVSERLERPERDEPMPRTHQPGIEALIEVEMINPESLEQDWGAQEAHQRTIPWGWFVLIGLILASAAIWSLSRVKNAEIKAEKLKAATESVLVDEAREEQEAGELVDRMETITREFFDATNVESLSRHVRHPERVRPLMERYHEGNPVTANRVNRIKMLQPLTLDNRANFWMTTVELSDQDTRNLVIEVLDNGEPRIDWETLVCYQPMKWDNFATQRPAGESLDFRVYIEQDSFFSHEFADSTRWTCFRLTARDSEETLFGYAKANGDVDQSLLQLLTQNQGRKASVILRLSIPEGLQSRRGVVIEKLLSPRWLYVNPPED